MGTNNIIAKIFMLPRQSGPGGCACGGPVGQSSEQIRVLQHVIEAATGYHVDVYDITNRGGDMQNYRVVFDLMSTSGVKVLPVITLNDEVVSTGKVWPESVIAAIQKNMNRAS